MTPAPSAPPPTSLEGPAAPPPPFDFRQEDVLALLGGQRPLLFDLRVLDRGAGEPDRGDTHGVAGAQSLAKIRFQLLPETHRRKGSGLIGRRASGALVSAGAWRWASRSARPPSP